MRRCEVRTKGADPVQCPEAAAYVIARGGKASDVCEKCMPSWVHTLSKLGRVTVMRIGFGQVGR